jgi:hypothetical protein
MRKAILYHVIFYRTSDTFYLKNMIETYFIKIVQKQQYHKFFYFKTNRNNKKEN